MLTILVPLDGSPHAERALPYAQELALLLKARVALLCSVPAAVSEPALAGFALERDHTPLSWVEQYQSTEAYVARRAAVLESAGVHVTTTIWVGAAAEHIIEVATTQHASVIVMARHDGDEHQGWSLGSLADQVVHGAPCPVLLVHDAVDAPSFKRILVPLDGSALSQHALPLALDIAAQAEARIFLLQAIHPFVELESAAHPLKLCADAQDQLTSLADTLPAEIPITPLASIGYPAEEIIATAASRQIDLVVMATHGYSGFKRWMIGSVADAVLQETTRPLLLVRPPMG